MGDSLWNLDEVSAGEQRVLSEKEREFLMSGDPGSYTSAKMERRAAEKAEKLPDRIQQLVDDVCLLYYRGYVGTSETREIWEDLLTITNRSQIVRDSPIVQTEQSSEIDLGFEIGSLIRMLHGGDSFPDFTWGTIVGLAGESSENWETEAKNLVELFDNLEERYEWRLFSAGAEAQLDDGFTEEREEIREILRDYGFAPAPPLVHSILLESTDDGEQSLIEHTERSWRADPDQTDHPTPPDEHPSTEEMRQSGFELVVSRLEEQTHLRDLDRLAKDLREDAIRIQQPGWRKVDIDQAFRVIAENDETQIQEFDQTEEKGQNNMTTALRRLSYKDSPTVNRPVIQENEGDNIYWSLTSYGELLYEVRVVHNCSTNWMYDYIANSGEISDEISQLISELI
ncbi:hypothetical protein KM295_12255 [Natronomonas sp. F2-12]|uniref:Uncharacterized protein n=1 Tax=Natronomonas aquatica TaxID=2841590 RepID=A0A9R1CVA1_9EURY|nr:hypothetical protein [Natronomonas aquatica]MCQ4334236.1 hypothetical protein [Natronomonas aquatica]